MYRLRGERHENDVIREAHAIGNCDATAVSNKVFLVNLHWTSYFPFAALSVMTTVQFNPIIGLLFPHRDVTLEHKICTWSKIGFSVYIREGGQHQA